MEVEMEDDITNGGDTAVEFTFTAVEIDLDYEYDAVRFYDFTRDETVGEAFQAEMWFESVGSYPHSPFALRLLSREQSENADVSISSQGFGNLNQLNSVSDVVQIPEDSSMALCSSDGYGANEGVPLDIKSYCQQAFQKQQTTSTIPKDSTRNANYKSKTKSSWKPSLQRTSTLMKPTASQLAKQNQERVMDHFRFQKSGNSSVVESQAAKRQKLEGGHLCKATDTNQQANFVHKAPKKEGPIDGNLGHGRLRITVPRPPDLATAQRAQRIRQKVESGSEHVASRATGFRARPLNRKIFEAPSLLQSKRSTPQLPEFHEFRLKTTERAGQNTNAVPSTSARCNNFQAPQKPGFAFSAENCGREYKGPHVTGAPKPEECEPNYRFKALRLNKKIFSSKGDLGVFRSSKRETTDFNFQTDKRAQHAPPVDLFNKLSLASERQQDSSSHLNRPRPRSTSIFTKDSKENRVCSIQQQSEMKRLPTDKLSKMGSEQVITEGIPLSTISRNLGIR
ncbi:TPX2, central domain-containing protein [Artemisia annua]|uniref:TPX2, central domain-containing protein n=1 Tax=Artemisia annua TaxID=35608 RepID=A0A2U1NGS5_ARTAN|nr:TPX2, central domain-containing protein [Artemisia annua]